MIEIIRVKQLILNLLEYIPKDLENHKNDEENTFLYRLLYGMKDGNFDFYQQAKSLFTRSSTNPRKIEVRLEFPKDKTGLPCYVIREPGKTKGPANSIGKLNGEFILLMEHGKFEIVENVVLKLCVCQIIC